VEDAILITATAVLGLGLILILWRELAGAASRRQVGQLRDTVEVILPVAAAVALLWWVWVY
jgi:hypothetical protein